MKTKARRRGGGVDHRAGGEEHHDEKGRVRVSRHHETSGDGMADLDHAKHVGPVRGEHGRHTAARSPRKNGGEVGADRRPFSSARHGTEPKGRHTMPDD